MSLKAYLIKHSLINITEEDKEKSCDVASDVAALEEVLRMVLEIINSTLISQNKANANFIYTLLYHQHIFEPFNSHPNFQDLLQNVETVSSRYFTICLETKLHIEIQCITEDVNRKNK